MLVTQFAEVRTYIGCMATPDIEMEFYFHTVNVRNFT